MSIHAKFREISADSIASLRQSPATVLQTILNDGPAISGDGFDYFMQKLPGAAREGLLAELAKVSETERSTKRAEIAAAGLRMKETRDALAAHKKEKKTAPVQPPVGTEVDI